MKKRQFLATVVTVSLTTSIGGLLYSASPQHIHSQEPQSGGIAGRVLDAEGTPVSGATIYAQREDHLKGILPVAKTHEGGVFRIKGLKPGKYWVKGSKEEDGDPLTTSAFQYGLPQIHLQVNVHKQKVTRDVVVYLSARMGKLVGRILDLATHQPIHGASITLRRTDNADVSYRAFPNNPKKRGEFELTVPPVSITMEVSAPGYENWHYSSDASKKQTALRVASGETKHLTISLRPVK